jgi:hypothetical protein
MDWSSHLRRILTKLGEDVVFKNFTGSGVTVRGMFMSAYQAADLGVVGVTGTNPMFAAMTADLPLVDTRATIRRASVTYKVRVVLPEDQSGITVLELRKP